MVKMCIRDSIQGVVTDSLTNEPIPYLSVFYEGKGVGSITDNDGNYKVETRKGWNKQMCIRDRCHINGRLLLCRLFKTEIIVDRFLDICCLAVKECFQGQCLCVVFING